MVVEIKADVENARAIANDMVHMASRFLNLQGVAARKRIAAIPLLARNS